MMLLAPKNEVFCGKPVTARLANILRNRGITSMEGLRKEVGHLWTTKNAGRKVILEAKILLGTARIVTCKDCGEGHECITSQLDRRGRRIGNR